MRDDTPSTGSATVVLPVLVNDLGVIASAARTLLERWEHLPEDQRGTLLSVIDQSVERGMARLDALAS